MPATMYVCRSCGHIVRSRRRLADDEGVAADCCDAPNYERDDDLYFWTRVDEAYLASRDGERYP